jgi:3-oxoacyl-(acyl-carrier-protein) synthase
MSGRNIVVAGSAVMNCLGRERAPYYTRTGRFTEVIPDYSRFMGLVEVKNGIRYPAKQIVAGRAIDAPQEMRQVPLTRERERELYREYIDWNIGLRAMLPGDNEEPEFDPQRFRQLVETPLQGDTTINGVVYKKGETIGLARYVKLGACHGGPLPTGLDLRKEGGFPDENPYDEMGLLHLMFMRMAADALISMGVPWEEVAKKIPPEERDCAVASGLGPGKHLRRGMIDFFLGRKLHQNVLGWYINDTLAWLAKLVFGAYHASTRLGACDTEICNEEDLFGRMISGDFSFGVVASMDTAINEAIMEAFLAKKALANDRHVATLKDHPSLVSRPGRVDRFGFALATGGALFVHMDEEIAKERQVNIYARQLASVTATSGAQMNLDFAAPTNAVKTVMRKAIIKAARQKGVSPEEIVRRIRFIKAHGTSTPAGDSHTIKCYEEILTEFGRNPKDPVWVVYDKGGPRIEDVETARQVGIGNGHTGGGAAGIAKWEAINILREKILPPSVSSIGRTDPEIQGARRLVFSTTPTRIPIQEGDLALIEADGFGDNHGAVILEATEELDPTSPAAQWSERQFQAIENGEVTPFSFVPNLQREIR